ncbi:hypothetical protein GTQ55_15445 [Microbulbifer hydrolyticus]|uniref:Uncharacterized protein n=2 Tax=Microbulbifer hydrolyticus TaxID=48074 RepID=A0A6P1TF23_9GAMM|nr:hypothetical protein [Microbulbifer hydrolyticus]MBB5212630.1 hypothetical protein [Microbulbifer hydrolyticus]QHQ40235.1 hypothetical protein GTQ55_15445 [Microbulbifer hydrolyticus]
MVLVLSVTAVLIFFRLHIFLTVTPFECWGFEDVWDHRPDTLNPFWMYTLVFLLLTAWSLLELALGVFSKSQRFVPFVSLVLMISVLFGHLHFWQAFQVTRGEAEFSHFTLELVHFRRPEPEERRSDFPPSWQEYLIENRCSKGLAISSMSDQEREELHRKYLELWD